MKRKDLKYNANETIGLNELAPTLASLKKVNPFAVDEKYFDKLPVEILSKINQKEHKSYSMKILDGMVRPKYAFPLLATVILIMVAFFVFERPPSIIKLTLAEYSFNDVLSESPEIFETMDESTLIEALFADNDDLMTDYFDFENGATFTSGELDDYLSEEDLTPEIFTDF